MFVFISGGVRSGKSKLGEQIANELAKGNKIYLATSKVYDDEMKDRIKRHQENREKKDFITIEKSENISEILNKLNPADTVLMDCLGTLVANEMFGDYEGIYTDELKNNVLRKIFSDIILIKNNTENFIIISNEIFSDGITYDLATEVYIEVLGQLHIKIAKVAEKAIECVFGNNIVNYEVKV